MHKRVAASTAAVMIAFAASAVTAHAGVNETAKKKHPPKKYVHTTKIAYRGPCAVDAWNAVTQGPELGVCVSTPIGVVVGAKDRYFSASVADASGQPVAIALVTQGVNTSGGTVNQVFCGSVKNFPIGSGAYDVMPALAVGDTSCPVPPTQGTITVSLSNRK